MKPARPPTIVFLVTTDWYFWSHRLPIARAARKAGFHVVVATRVESHGEAMRGEGFEVLPIAIPRAFGSPWAEIRSLLEIFGLYRRVRPALAHHISVKCALYGTLSARLARVPAVINTLPGLGYLFTSRQWRARALRPLARLSLRRSRRRRVRGGPPASPGSGSHRPRPIRRSSSGRSRSPSRLRRLRVCLPRGRLFQLHPEGDVHRPGHRGNVRGRKRSSRSRTDRTGFS